MINREEFRALIYSKQLDEDVTQKLLSIARNDYWIEDLIDIITNQCFDPEWVEDLHDENESLRNKLQDLEGIEGEKDDLAFELDDLKYQLEDCIETGKEDLRKLGEEIISLRNQLIANDI